ncbi:MAG: YfhO family protein [Planctomycetes bacterium]|nr:YfhO family protein [Planctomycetota bacterium]
MNARAVLLGAAKVSALALLALLFTASFHHRVAFGPQTFALAGTLGADPVQHGVPRVVHDPYASSGQFEPWLDHQLREEERHGEAPRWNPWQGLGAPFLANAQTAVYHPVRWLQELLPPSKRFDVAVLIHFATAALGMWFLLRALALERLSAALGAVAFSCSGYLVFFANMVHLGAEALLPWHMLGIELLWRGRRVAGALLFGGSFALSHVAGFPEATALCALFALLWLLALVLHALGTRRALAWLGAGALLLAAAWFGVGGASSNAERIARGNASALAAALWICALCLVPRVTRARCAALGLALLSGTAIAAPALLPFLEFLSRAQHLHGGERWSGLTGFELSTARGLAFPNLERYGAGMNAGYTYGEPPYVGALVIGLGLLAPFLARTTHPARRSALLFLTLALLVTAKLFLFAPVQWLGEVPPLREIIARKYLGIGLAFAWAGSAACGLAALRAQSAARASFLVLGLGAAALYAARTFDAGWAIASWRWLLSTPFLVCAGWLAIGGLAFVALRRASRPRLAAISAALLLLGVSAELYLDAPRKRASRELAHAAPKGLARWTQRLRGERVIGVDGVLPPNLATRYEIQDVRFLDAMVEAGIYRYLDAHFDLPLHDRWDGPARESRLPDHEELDHLGIRWLLAPRRWLAHLQELRIDLAVAAVDHGVRRLAEGPNRGLRLPPGARLFAGPLQVPRTGGVRAAFVGLHQGTLPGLTVHRLGSPSDVFVTPRLSLEGLRARYGNAPELERAPIGFGRERGRLPRELFADKPVLFTFKLDLDGRPLSGARLDLTEVRWEGGPLPAESFRAAVRLSEELVLDDRGQRRALDEGAPNRLWLLPSSDPALGAHLYVDYRFPAGVSEDASLRLAIEAQPVLGTAPALAWQRREDALWLDLEALRGETLYLELHVEEGSSWRLDEALLEGDSPRYRIHQREPLVVAENLRAQPVAYLTHRARVVPEAELEARLRAERTDPRREVWVSGEHARALDVRDPLPERAVQLHRPRADTLVVDFEARGPGLLVVLEPYDPGWKVRINGRHAPLVPVFGAFRGVYVNDGDRRIVMQYRPDAWMFGLVISSATAGVVLLWLLGSLSRPAIRSADPRA